MAIKHDAISGRSNLYNVDPRAIKVRDGWNPRIDFEGPDMEDLKNSIIENGVKLPLTLTKIGEDLCVRDGERRLRATMQAISEGHDIQTVPAIFTRPNISDVEALTLTLISNDGKPLNPVEEAEAYQRLRSWGLPVADIARKIGKSPVHVYKRIILVDASPELKQEIKEKNVTLQDAENIIKESSGNIEKQNRRSRAVNKSNRMKMPEIKSLLKEKETINTPVLNERYFNDGVVWALKKVLGVDNE